jgi:Ca-activated chloride channel family protein
VAGRVPAGDGDGLTFRLATGREVVDTLDWDASGQATEQPALKALFGARRILGLEYLIHSGLQGDELEDQLLRLGYHLGQVQIDKQSAVYAENAREAVREALKGLLASEALVYGLASAETAFVGVRTEAGQRVEGTVAVANALPAGWSDAFLSAPPGGVQMATAAFMGVAAPKSLGLPSLSAAQPAALRAAPKDSGWPRLRRTRGRRGGGMVAREVTRDRGAGMDQAAPAAAGVRTIFSGTPSLLDGRAVLWEETLATGGTLSGIEVAFEESAPERIDRGLALWIYVEDLALPRARIRLADLVQLGGKRPLNLRVRAGGVVRVVLVDGGGVWTADGASLPGGSEISIRIAM